MRDLRVGVDAVRRGVIVRRSIAISRDVLNGAKALVGRDVGEHDAADHVADRPDALRARAEVLVDHDAAALELDTGLLGLQSLRVGHAADGEQHLVGVERATFAA